MRLWRFIKDLVLLERNKHHMRVENSRRVELYRFPVIGSQIRKE